MTTDETTDKPDEPIALEDAVTVEALAVEVPPTDAPTTVPTDAPDPLRTVEAWRDELETPSWAFAAAKAGLRWAIGQELTKQRYIDGIHWASNIACR